MAIIDLNKERQRLAQVYAGLGEVELREVAGEAGSLTEVAKAALRFEISRRGLEIELDESSVAANNVPQRQLVTLRRFRDLPEAHIAKSILESAGIECFLADENVIRIDWYYSNAVGGVKLWVERPEAEEAVGLLDQSAVERFDAVDAGEYLRPRCPNCASFDVSFEDLNKYIAQRVGLLGVFGAIAGLIALAVLRGEGWKCRSCRHEWPKRDDEII